MIKELQYNYSMNLLDRINQINAETSAWIAEDPTNRGAGLLFTDTSYWADFGVHTADDLDRYLLATDVWEMTRNVYGYKANWGALFALSLDELKAEMAALEFAADKSA